MGGRGGRIFQENKRASNLPIFENAIKIKQPDEYKNKSLSKFGVYEHLRKKTLYEVVKHEKKYYLDHTEQMAIIDKKGEIIYKKRGERTHVTFDGTLAKDKIITHNHPSALPILSPTDINTFIDSGALEMRATGLAGQVTRVYKKYDANVTPQMLEEFKREYSKVFNQSVNYAKQNHIQRKAKEIVTDENRYNGMTIHYFNNFPDFMKDHINYIEKNMNFKKYGICYVRIKEA